MALRGGSRDWIQQYQQRKRTQQAQQRQSAMFGQMQEQSRGAEAAGQAIFGQMGERSRAAEAAGQSGYERMLGVAAETTGQRQADIRQDYASRAADITQQQARLGMSGTTVGTSLRGGVEREKQSSLNRLADTMQQTKLGIMSGQAAAGERFAGQQIGVLGQQAGAGERFAGQRAAMMGQQAGLSTAIPVAEIGAGAQRYASDAELRMKRARVESRMRGWGGKPTYA
ncbi:hypothetical protein LCGC14_2035490 [marine sediment metagenome]|uniref:Uncharacterized protein n=1 Tax=marine sediment metagenome TaxID=412755 RepID=A0A0F9ETC8_9ZZZZ